MTPIGSASQGIASGSSAVTPGAGVTRVRATGSPPTPTPTPAVATARTAPATQGAADGATPARTLPRGSLLDLSV